MSAPRLVRRTVAGETTEFRHYPAVEEEAEDQAPRPTSRRVSFELPDGYAATISLVPYTETAVALADVGPELPAADPALIGRA